MNIQCAGCLKDCNLIDAKRIGKYYYCPTCQSYIINSLKTDSDGNS